MSNEKNWLAKQLSAGALRAVAGYVVSWVLPILVPLVLVVTAGLQQYPWPLIIALAAFTFAMMSLGLVFFSAWRQKLRVEDKLVFHSVSVGRSITDGGLALGIHLQSKASFPMDFDILEMRTRLGTVVPLQRPYQRTRFTIPPEGFGWFHDHSIDISNAPRNGTVEGFLEFKLRYGRGDAMKYQIASKKQVICQFNAEGTFTGAAVNDAS